MLEEFSWLFTSASVFNWDLAPCGPSVFQQIFQIWGLISMFLVFFPLCIAVKSEEMLKTKPRQEILLLPLVLLYNALLTDTDGRS